MANYDRERLREIWEFIYAETAPPSEVPGERESEIVMAAEDWETLLSAVSELIPRRKCSLGSASECYFDVRDAIERAEKNGERITESEAIARVAVRHGPSTRRNYYRVKKLRQST
jgi:hypothetical protein